jgi:hypothetical protein
VSMALSCRCNKYHRKEQRRKAGENKNEKRSAQHLLRVESAQVPVPSGLSFMKVETTTVCFPVCKEGNGWFQSWPWW